MTDIEDDFSELSSLSSYPRFPGTFSENLQNDLSDIFHIHFNDDKRNTNPFPQSPSPSLVPTPVLLVKRKESALYSWVLGKPEEPLGQLVEIDATGNASCVLNIIHMLMNWINPCSLVFRAARAARALFGSGWVWAGPSIVWAGFGPGLRIYGPGWPIARLALA
ncbi:hypothetical protein HOY82DRAFT_544042 [Tuber indicum]|nr:hypothetical protein HOY82DRAFT_544042 [Tuber indicum]